MRQSKNEKQRWLSILQLNLLIDSYKTFPSILFLPSLIFFIYSNINSAKYSVALAIVVVAYTFGV